VKINQLFPDTEEGKRINLPTTLVAGRSKAISEYLGRTRLTLRLMNEKLFHEIERLRFLEPELYVWFEERAAVMHFDGGLTREEAEREALHLTRQKKASERTLRREA
jgi:hypothetical protein